MRDRIRTLIVDDSAIVRDVLERGLALHPDIEVVGKASDAFSARDRIVLLRPDVVTLDVEMPGMNGIEFLRRLLPQYPIPVIVVSAVTAEGSARAFEALSAGAVDVVPKPRGSDREGLARMVGELADRIREAAAADVGKIPRRSSPGNRARDPRNIHDAPHAKATRGAGDSSARVLAIGASTGGTAVIGAMVPEFPADMPGTLIVQHMPPVFTRLFAESLDRASRVSVREAKDGDAVEDGLVLVAPGDLHMTLARRDERWFVRCLPGEKVSGHRPSVDVLFSSVADAAGSRAVGVLMTGMGRDGADGLLRMREAGARCFAQDEATSVVFGMPREAILNGAAERAVPADDIAGVAIAALASRAGKGAGRWEP